jgi:hypothetical protein
VTVAPAVAAPAPVAQKPESPDDDLPSPQREWAAVFREVPDHPTRMERLLGVASTFAARGDLDNEDRTLLYVIEHDAATSVFSQRARQQRAWHAQKRGDLPTALARAEELAFDGGVDVDVRAQAAYSASLFAFGLDEHERVARAIEVLRGSPSRLARTFLLDIDRRLVK